MEAVEALKISEHNPTSPHDLQDYILSKNNMNLEETVKAVEGKESGKVAKMKVGVKPNVAGIVTELAIPPIQLKGKHLA